MLSQGKVAGGFRFSRKKLERLGINYSSIDKIEIIDHPVGAKAEGKPDDNVSGASGASGASTDSRTGSEY